MFGYKDNLPVTSVTPLITGGDMNELSGQVDGPSLPPCGSLKKLWARSVEEDTLS